MSCSWTRSSSGCPAASSSSSGTSWVCSPAASLASDSACATRSRNRSSRPACSSSQATPVTSDSGRPRHRFSARRRRRTASAGSGNCGSWRSSRSTSCTSVRTDVQEVERLLRQDPQLPEPADAVRRLRRALNLWRGRPLSDVTGVAWLEEQAGRLDLLRLRVAQALSEARLAAGEHTQLVPELEELAAGHPLDERVHEQLMLALYRSGRQADALAVYHRLRHTLHDELGIDPGQALRDLEMAILRQDPALTAPASPAPPAALAAPLVPTPAQLPSAMPAFTGRTAEL